MPIELQGQIERVTYTNDENGYTIAKVKVSGRQDLVTVVGNLLAPTPGEIIQMQGEWSHHPKYGEQFKIVHYQSVVPASVYGMEKYLGSGLIKGIGPVMAKRIIQAFGQATLDIIENRIERLTEVEGIGEKRIQMIRQAWNDQKEIRQVMLFLQTHGVGTGYAVKIFKQYGDRSIAVVKNNPYRLAQDIFGIGFVIADTIAAKLGFAKDSPARVQAGILYVLNQLSDEGHVYYPYQGLIEKSCAILEVGRDQVAEALAAVALEKKIVIEDLNRNLEAYQENHKAVYLARFHLAETGAARLFKALVQASKSIRPLDTAKALEWVQGRLGITLASKQCEAIRCALDQKAMIITGGPGTGKTTIIHAILKIISRIQAKVLLAAPTGRAAKRMTETTGLEAKTIHRLLEYSLQKGGFQRNQDKPLECDLLIVDEASMIDLLLMHQLLKAVPPQATLILVGDMNQLPSVGAGNVLKDIIRSRIVPVVELNEIFRQAKESRIIVNAHKINHGFLPDLESADQELSDFYFIHQEDPEEVLKIILELVKQRIPRRFGLDPMNDIQVLTPMHKGLVGAANLNLELQKELNPGEAHLARGNRTFRINDKVMQVRNNYDKDVFNGDIGRIKNIDPENQTALIVFDERDIPYDFNELDEIVLAYAISVHKSQGSEYPAVILPVLTQHFILLQRNLIYTGVTRGRKLVVLIGTPKALALGIKNDKPQHRYTNLEERLQDPS